MKPHFHLEDMAMCALPSASQTLPAAASGTTEIRWAVHADSGPHCTARITSLLYYRWPRGEQKAYWWPARLTGTWPLRMGSKLQKCMYVFLLDLSVWSTAVGNNLTICFLLLFPLPVAVQSSFFLSCALDSYPFTFHRILSGSAS